MGDTYCTNAEVQAEFRSLDITSTGAAMSAAKIEAFRDQVYAYINARIGNKYATPIAEDAACFGIIKMVELWLVKARINTVLPVKTSSDDAKQGDSPPELNKKAEELLEQIISGKMKMEGASLASSADGASSFNVSQGNEHLVKKDEDQW